MQTSSIRIPAIVSDIDGVLVNGKGPIPKSADAVRFLQTSLKDIDRDRFIDIEQQIPFVFVTNGGGYTERTKAESISTILKLDGSEKLSHTNVVMNYTPLKPIMQEYVDKVILLSGVGDIELIAKDTGIQKYVTDEEYCALFPYLVPESGRPHTGEAIEGLRRRIAERLDIKDQAELNEPFQIHAIFLISDPILWDERIQIICDLLSSSDGKIPQQKPLIGPEEHIPVYGTNNDITYRKDFRLPRLGFGCFNDSLKEIYQVIYRRELELIMYGKPYKTTFDFLEKFVKGLTNIEISNIYMIGDNPKSDIRGGNAIGWKTILVKTGVFQQTEEIMNDPEDPATYVVEDFAEAIKLICELEGIKCDF